MRLRLCWVIGVLVLFGASGALNAQENVRYSLDEIIAMAQQYSPDALIAEHNFRASYWQYRSFKAQYLPSLNLSSTLGNFNRSLVALQNAETGGINYRDNYNMRNSLQLSVDQNLAFTGGTLSLYSSLERLDQYAPDRSTTYASQPISISYIQPLGGYNSLKWQKKTEPIRYEQAKRTYLESMEEITVKAVAMFFDLLVAEQTLEMAVKNFDNTEKLYQIAQERFKIGSVTKSELLQLELRKLNDGLAINESQMNRDLVEFQMIQFLGLPKKIKLSLVPPTEIPSIDINYEEVLRLAYENSSFSLTQELLLLNASQDVAQSKADRGISATLRAQFGLTQTGPNFGAAYASPIDQEVVSVGLQMPLMDWGLGRGRVKMSLSKEEVVKMQVAQEVENFKQDVFMKTLQYNNQTAQCRISARADTIANERYRMSMEQFANGTISVLELTNAQSEKDQASNKYLQELSNFWNYYYTLRKMSLYDFQTQTNISTEFDKIIEK